MAWFSEVTVHRTAELLDSNIKEARDDIRLAVERMRRLQKARREAQTLIDIMGDWSLSFMKSIADMADAEKEKAIEALERQEPVSVRVDAEWRTHKEWRQKVEEEADREPPPERNTLRASIMASLNGGAASIKQIQARTNRTEHECRSALGRLLREGKILASKESKRGPGGGRLFFAKTQAALDELNGSVGDAA